MVTRYTRTGAIEIRSATLTIPSTDGRKSYTLTLDPADGEAFACSCPDFEFRKSKVGKVCKHIENQRRGTYTTLKPHIRVRPVPR